MNFKISLKGFALKDYVLKNLKDCVLKIKRLCLKSASRIKNFAAVFFKHEVLLIFSVALSRSDF